MNELSPRDVMMLSLLQTSISPEEAKQIVKVISPDAQQLASKILKKKPVEDLRKLGAELELAI